MKTDENTRDAWLALANLFFLDTEPDEGDYSYAAELLKEKGWDKERSRNALIELIAPEAGVNLGYLIYPVIGVWEGFDKDFLCERIERRVRNRAKYPKWWFAFSDWYCASMLHKLDMHKLLERL